MTFAYRQRMMDRSEICDRSKPRSKYRAATTPTPERKPGYAYAAHLHHPQARRRRLHRTPRRRHWESLDTANASQVNAYSPRRNLLMATAGNNARSLVIDSVGAATRVCEGLSQLATGQTGTYGSSCRQPREIWRCIRVIVCQFHCGHVRLALLSLSNPR
jgi:hypothetical protein